jgi:hypothetical protein
MKIAILFVFSVIIAPAAAAEANVYYVDPNGADSNSGSIESPWKTINRAQAKLSPGDTLYVRGGTYNGQVEITVNGREDAPITIAAYPGETPVLTNTVGLRGWTQCTLTDANLVRGKVRNENWPSIWMATSTDPDNDPKVLFEKQKMLRKAIWPNQSNIWPNPEEWFPVPGEGGNFGQKNYVVDSKNLTQADDYWNKAQVRIWSHAANNWIIDSSITDFSGADHKITFSTPLAYALSNGGSRPDGYAIMNSPMVLDEPGEWCYVRVAKGWRVYLWPLDVNDLETNLAYLNWYLIGQQVPGLIVCGRTDFGNHIVIDGLTLRDCRRGFEWIRWYGNGNFRGLTIRNCVVEQAYSSAAVIWNVDNLLIENCTFRDICADDYALCIVSCKSPIVRNCRTENTCGTGIYLSGPALTGAIIENNRVGVTGIHGNGMSAYDGCSDVLFARNIVRTPMVGITLYNTSNTTIYANVVKNQGHGAQIAIWDSPDVHVTGYLRVLNNVLIGGSGLYGGTTGHTRYVYNNIMTGTSVVSTGRDYSLFVTSPTSLGAHESVATNLSDIFVDPNNDDWHLKPGSPAIQRGTDITPYLPAAFQSYDFGRDADGNSWGTPLDLGAYRSPQDPNAGLK